MRSAASPSTPALPGNILEKRSPGRPREFDRSTALHAAMIVFWRYGYEASSLTQLTEAMQISRPTLYATFGDKARLFRETVVAYTAIKAQEFADALALPTVRQVAEAFLRLTGGLSVNPGVPSGCLLVQGALVGTPGNDVIRAELTALRDEGTVQLLRRLHQAREEGDLPPGIDPETLAQYLTSLANGMAIQSASGISPAHLNRVIDLAMAHWPASSAKLLSSRPAPRAPAKRVDSPA